MYCIKCGERVLSNSNFCAKCGTKIENHIDNNIKEVNIVSPKKKSNAGLIIALIFGFLFLIGGLTVGALLLLGTFKNGSIIDNSNEANNNYNVESLSNKQKVKFGKYEIEIPYSAYYEEDLDSNTLAFEYNDVIYEVGLLNISYDLLVSRKEDFMSAMNGKVPNVVLSEVYEREADNKGIVEFKGKAGTQDLIVAYTSLDNYSGNCLAVFAYGDYLPEQDVLNLSKSLADSFTITRGMSNEESGFIDFSPIYEVADEFNE